jgi:hypothetical protein
VWLLCQVGHPRFDLLARAWRRLANGGQPQEPLYVRREPSFDAPAELGPGRRQPPFSVEPAFELESPARTTGEPTRRPTGDKMHLRRPIVRDPEFDRTTDAASHAMARRFAPPPAREEPPGSAGLGLFRRRWPLAGRTDEGRAPTPGERQTERRPVWPGSVPAPAEEEKVAGHIAPTEPLFRREGDALYGRAVALVRAHRKVSAAYLQQSLGIRYMRAADLIDRMEREGIVGAPVHGTRAILGTGARARIV